MSYDALGQAAKAKYPGAYDGYGDAELGQVIAQKYPDYQSYAEGGTQPATQDPTSLLKAESAGDTTNLAAMAPAEAKAETASQAAIQPSAPQQAAPQKSLDPLASLGSLGYAIPGYGAVKLGMGLVNDILHPGQVPGQVSNALHTAGGIIPGVQNSANDISQALAVHTPEYQQAQQGQSDNQQMDAKILKMASDASHSGNTQKAQQLLAITKLGGGLPTAEDTATNGQGFRTPGQIAGDFTQLGSNALMGFNPASELTGLAGTAARAVTNGAAGLIGATGHNLSQGQDLGQAAQGALPAAALSAAIPAGLEGAAGLAKGIAGAGSNVIYNNVVGTPLKQALKGTDNAQFLQQNGISGSYPSMIQKLQALTDNMKSQIGGAISGNADKFVTIDPLVQKLEQLQNDKLATGNSSGNLQNIIDAIKAKAAATTGEANQIPVADAQALKKLYGKEIGPAFFAANPQTEQANRIAYHGLDSQLDQALQGTSYTQSNDTASGAIKALEAVTKRSEQQPNRLSQGLDALLGAQGLGGNLPALGLYGVKKVAGSPTLGTPLAQGLYGASKTQINPQLLAVLQKAGIGLANH